MYTYLIGWSKLNRWYYGVSFKEGRTEQDLWKTYFTSSKYVKEFVSEHGDPDIIVIRKRFVSGEKARLWESRVLRRLNVVHDDRWLNKTDNRAIDPERALAGSLKNKGKEKTAAHKAAIAESIKKRHAEKGHPRLGLKHTDESKAKMRERRLGKKHTDEARRKISESSRTRTRAPISEETRRKISESLKGRPLSEERKNKLRGPRGPNKRTQDRIF